MAFQITSTYSWGFNEGSQKLSHKTQRHLGNSQSGERRAGCHPSCCEQIEVHLGDSKTHPTIKMQERGEQGMEMVHQTPAV